MSKIVDIKDLLNHVGEEVTVRGWLYHKRGKGKLFFLLVRDGCKTVQCVVFKGDVSEDVFEKVGQLTQESSLVVTGVVKEDERSPGGCELGITNIEIIQIAEEYPIVNQKDQGIDHLMKHRHLWLRSKKQHAQMRVRATVIKAVRDFLDNDGYLCVDSPIFTPAACEGTTTLFECGYFEDKAYLTQSGQLYNEAAAMAHGKVYCFGPTFRAEKSKTRRHLTEFWMVEPEAAFLELDGIMDLAERFVAYIVEQCLEHRKEELEILERDTSLLEKIVPPFPRLSYDECVKMMNDNGHEFEWGGDFGAPDETFLCEKYDKPILVHRFPAAVKAFYMKADPESPKHALCVDMLAPEGCGEIIGGGQRSDDLDYLLDKIKEHKLPQESFEWYLDLRRYGTVPHGGFGLGIERTVAWICGTHHVRECIPFPRMIYKIYP